MTPTQLPTSSRTWKRCLKARTTITSGVKVFEHPEALVFKGAHAADLRSRVCEECGYVESYVENPQELYAAYLAGTRERQE